LYPENFENTVNVGLRQNDILQEYLHRGKVGEYLPGVQVTGELRALGNDCDVNLRL
jgi:hypothetical protein